MNEGIVVITIDGDHTAEEFQRIATQAMAQAEPPVPILLDLAGAAGLKGQPDGAAEFFARHEDEVSRIAVTSANVKRLPSGRVLGFTPFEHIESEPFNSRSDALSWLLDAL